MQRIGLVVVLGLVGLAGCATAQRRGEMALRQGRYDEAIGHFEQALAKDPAQLDTLVGLGLSQYKLGAFDEAITALARAVTQAPKSETAQLYLGLSYLQKGEDGPAEEHLRTFLGLPLHPRIAAQVDRALKLMRSDHLSPDMRGFITASLDDEAEWTREMRLAQYAYPAPGFYRSRYPFGPCFMTRIGGVVCY